MTTERATFSITHEPLIRGEKQWPAALTVLTALLLYLILPRRITLGPPWLLPLIEVALLTAVVARRHRAIVALDIVTLILAVLPLVLAVGDLLHGHLRGIYADGQALVLMAAGLWLTIVLVFAVWYWVTNDAASRNGYPDFLFPQMTIHEVSATPWAPAFVDYLYIAVTTGTVVGLAANIPMTPRAKLAMLLQVAVSVLAIMIVVVGIAQLR